MWRRAKSAAHGRRTALPVRGDAARAHALGAAPASCQTKRPSNQGRAGQLRHCPPERPRCVRVARPHAQGVGRAERSARPDAERAHELSAAPASRRTARRSLVDAVRGAGQLRRRPAERPRRVRVERQQAQGLERVDRHLPPDAARSRGLCAAPASRRTARRSLVDAARGAGLVRRRHVERPRRVRVGRPHGHGVGRFERRVPQDTARAHWLRAAPASCQTKRPSNQGRRSI